MYRFVSLTIASLIFCSSVSAQSPAKTVEYEYQTFFLVLLNKGPNWSDAKTPQIAALQNQHVAHILKLGETGQEVAAGPLDGSQNLLGVAVYSVPTLDDAKKLAATDPAVKVERMRPEIYPWYAAKGIMKMPVGPLKLSTYYLGFLRKGSSWTPGETPESRKIQDGHMANIRRLAGLGKLVIAGPTTDSTGDLRGIFVFKTGSMEEARQLAETDPAIKAGRLKIDLYTWMVPAGTFKDPVPAPGQ